MSTSRTEPLPSDTILFQSWVNDRFKDYTLPRIEIKEGVDPCKKDETKIGLQARKYQEFIGKFLRFNSPYRSILLYHGVGSGKTCTAINTFNELYDSNPNWNVYILLKSSLKSNWSEELDKCLKKDKSLQDRRKRIHFITYNSPNASDIFKRIWTKTRIHADQSLFIIDEVHNFISNVVSNIQNNTGRSLLTYDLITDEIKRNKNSRILLLSATPIINRPFEIAVLFNLLKPDVLPNTEEDFKTWFIKETPIQHLNPATKNLLQRRIMGLVSYYIGATPDLYASQKTHEIEINMPDATAKTYEYWEAIEDEIEKKKALFRRMNKSDQVSDMFRSYTRQCCNFVFPTIGDKISGQLRPHPGDFRESGTSRKNNEVERFDQYGFEKIKKTKTTQPLLLKKEAYIEYDKHRKHYVDSVDKYWKSLGHLKEDLEKFNNQDLSPEEFMVDHFPKSSPLLKTMYESSPKMVSIALRCLKSPGNSMIYSYYVRMEGLELMCKVLEHFGFSRYQPSMGTTKKLRYVEIHHGIGERPMQDQLKEVYNSKDNKYGEIIKVLLISPAMSEGISFHNVRQMHILEPYWHEVKIEQVKGRGIRQCSHSSLPMEERHCDIFRYKLIRKDERNTTDQEISIIAKRKKELLRSFDMAIKEVAIDCLLFREHNMMDTSYNCFRFNSDELLSGEKSYGYRTYIDEDYNKEDKGMNSQKYTNKTITVSKVQAVIRDPYTKVVGKTVENYWLDIDSGHVYDYETTNIIGKVKKDKSGVLEMTNGNTYIISMTIPINRYTSYKELQY